MLQKIIRCLCCEFCLGQSRNLVFNLQNTEGRSQETEARKSKVKTYEIEIREYSDEGVATGRGAVLSGDSVHFYGDEDFGVALAIMVGRIEESLNGEMIFDNVDLEGK